jgi:glycosyltransferase involved in cell wall biosynthesis
MIKVLFVSSGNSNNGISSIVKNQGESLISNGVDIHYFNIKGKGFRGYLSNIKLIKASQKEIQPDLIHAHYSLTAILSSLAGAKPLIVSLMGSDVKTKLWFRVVLWFFYKFYWSQTIVKSEDMKKSLDFKKVHVIPNGVDISNFKPLSKNKCQDKLNWDTTKTHILFAANPLRHEKNYNLAQKSVNNLKKRNIELHTLSDTPYNKIPILMNAANVILLTSLWEGSPNVIKEAMSCNCPIVATDVGDIKWLFGKEQGHFLTSFEHEDVTKKIERALEFSYNKCYTNGRQRIMALGLDSETIAKKITRIYSKIKKPLNRYQKNNSHKYKIKHSSSFKRL